MSRHLFALTASCVLLVTIGAPSVSQADEPPPSGVAVGTAPVASASDATPPPSGGTAPAEPTPGFQAWTLPEGWPTLLPPGVAAMPPGFMDSPGYWPRKLAVDDARLPPPLGYRLSSEPRRNLWVGGLVTLASSYGLAALIGAGVMSSGDDAIATGATLFIPLLGPAIFSAAVEPITTPSGRVGFVFGALASAAEGTGLALLIAGFMFPRAVYLRNDVDGPPSPGISLGPAPGGVGLHGTW